jgi:regulatory protein RepA
MESEKKDKQAACIAEINRRYPRITYAMALERPSLDFVLPGLLARTVGLICGMGSIGKGFLALHIAHAVATGIPACDGLWTPLSTGDVLVIFGEDVAVVLQERLHWLRQGVPQDICDIADRKIDIRSAAGEDMRILRSDGTVNPQFLHDLEVLSQNKRLVILDPLAFLHDADEKDNGAMTQLMRTLQGICKRTGTTIIVLHHFSKAGASDRHDSWAAARGASSLTTACRWQVNLGEPTEDEQDRYNIPEVDKHLYVRVATVKANYIPPTPPAILKRGKGGILSICKSRAQTESDRIDAAIAKHRASKKTSSPKPRLFDPKRDS